MPSNLMPSNLMPSNLIPSKLMPFNPITFRRTTLLAALALTLLASPCFSADVDLGAGAMTGSVPLRSIGPITFGSDGVLFVGDSTGAAIFAIDTGDRKATDATDVSVDDIDRKVAALLGTTAEDIEIHDLAVNPQSKTLYLSVTRGQGDAAHNAIVVVSAQGALSLLDLESIRFAKADLQDAPSAETKDRRGAPLRREALTDLEFHKGTLLVTGLSNEEFSSKLRQFSFPFSGVAGGTNVEIFHGAHGRWETNAPVRTMTVYDVEGSANVLAAYTCTPLVRFPLDTLTDGKKVNGTTVAELGNRNRPLDMFVYNKDGTDYVLMANSSRGVMKIDLDRISEVDEITEPVEDKAGLPYQTLPELEGVDQLARYGEERAVVLSRTEGTSSLRSIPLP